MFEKSTVTEIGCTVKLKWHLAVLSTTKKENGSYLLHPLKRKLNCNNYRGISDTSTTSRLYGRIFLDLIKEDDKEKEEEEQCGFRAGRSCADNVFTLKQDKEKRSARRRNKKVHDMGRKVFVHLLVRRLLGYNSKGQRRYAMHDTNQ